MGRKVRECADHVSRASLLYATHHGIAWEAGTLGTIGTLGCTGSSMSWGHSPLRISPKLCFPPANCQYTVSCTFPARAALSFLDNVCHLSAHREEKPGQRKGRL